MFTRINPIIYQNEHFYIDQIDHIAPFTSSFDEFPPGHPARYLHSISVNDQEFVAVRIYDKFYKVDPSEITSKYWVSCCEHTLEMQAWIAHIYKKKAGLYKHPIYQIVFKSPQIIFSDSRAYIATNKVIDDEYVNQQRQIADDYNDPEKFNELYLPYATPSNSVAYQYVKRFFPDHEPSAAHINLASSMLAKENEHGY